MQPVSGKGKVAGVYVTEGRVGRDLSVRVWRNKQVLCESAVSSLKRFKEDAKEVAVGYECGIGIKNFNDLKVGDTLEFFRKDKTG